MTSYLDRLTRRELFAKAGKTAAMGGWLLLAEREIFRPQIALAQGAFNTSKLENWVYANPSRANSAIAEGNIVSRDWVIPFYNIFASGGAPVPDNYTFVANILENYATDMDLIVIDPTVAPSGNDLTLAICQMLADNCPPTTPTVQLFDPTDAMVQNLVNQAVSLGGNVTFADVRNVVTVPNLTVVPPVIPAIQNPMTVAEMSARLTDVAGQFRSVRDYLNGLISPDTLRTVCTALRAVLTTLKVVTVGLAIVAWITRVLPVPEVSAVSLGTGIVVAITVLAGQAVLSKYCVV